MEYFVFREIPAVNLNHMDLSVISNFKEPNSRVHSPWRSKFFKLQYLFVKRSTGIKVAHQEIGMIMF